MRELARRFAVDTCGAAPLAQCLEWVESQSAGAGDQYLVFAHERRVHDREYEAVAASRLREWFAALVKPAHAHELIRGPVPPYADLDVDRSLVPDAEERCARFVAALEKEARRAFAAVATVDVLVVDASARTGTKFSRHVHARLTDAAGRALAFASTYHCRAFMEHVQRTAGYSDLIDVGVYRERGTLRTVYSTKLAAPERVLRPLDGPATPDFETFARALVTYQPVTDPRRWLRFARVTPARPLLLAPDSESTLMAHALALAPSLKTRAIVSAQRVSASTIRLVSASSECAACNARHGSNRIYFDVDVASGAYTQNCFSTKRVKTLVTVAGTKRARVDEEEKPSLRDSSELRRLFVGLGHVRA